MAGAESVCDAAKRESRDPPHAPVSPAAGAFALSSHVCFHPLAGELKNQSTDLCETWQVDGVWEEDRIPDRRILSGFFQ